ncbi:MAG: zinc ABC transporter substrate-binding protein [Eubacterium sp.]|nr:zinc ABC transporter substrate-binding protein [Eubacterium sp.]
MKKVFAVILSICLIACAFSACSGDKHEEAKGNKISIVTTIFPVYDWVREVVGDNENVEITMLLNKGVDLHNYQPTADDMITLSDCDLFIYVGGESDEWVDGALKNATNKNMKTLNLLETLEYRDQLKEEEIVEGMEAEEEEGEDEGPEYDEHIWLSLKNASVCVWEIANALKDIDNENPDKYSLNAKAYNDSLVELDTKYSNAVKSAKNKTLVFGDRFPFRYMTEDYGLEYYAAFVGCSAETEASFKTVQFLSKKVDEKGLKYVLVIENSDKKLANTIINNTKNKNAEILTLNSMQGITESDVKNGVKYYDTMKTNLTVLEKALN